MRAFVHIVVEQQQQNWSAWLGGAPYVAFDGELPADAIQRLVHAIGGKLFDANLIIPIDDVTRIGHLEFWVQFRKQCRIPIPSVN